MIEQTLLSLLLAGVVGAPQATQAPAQPAAVSPAQAPSEKPWPREGVLRIRDGVTAPKVIYEAKPRYTAEAMRARLEGTVEVQAVVEASGEVGDVRVVRSLDKEYGLDDRAVQAVKEWRFKPGTKDGKAVPVLVKIELTFKIKS